MGWKGGHNQVGAQQLCFFDGILAVLGLAADFKVSLARQEFANGFTNCRTVIDDEH
jgi:hypothetical protein